MTAAILAGTGVLVTRPAHQADGLCALIEADGGRALRFPTLEIAGPHDPAALTGALAALARYDLAVFVSPNAVERVLSHPMLRNGWPARVRTAVIGAGSARALSSRGVSVDIVPAHGSDSEALLAHPALQAMTDRRVVVFRGNGGRELLAATLRARGAEVDYAEVYRRVRPAAGALDLSAALSRGDVDVITATSADSLRNLCELVGAQGLPYVLDTPLVVVGSRMVQLAATLGFTVAPTAADSAADADMIAALRGWRRSALPGART
jgi:uroporphyrinogen-III synthase